MTTTRVSRAQRSTCDALQTRDPGFFFQEVSNRGPASAAHREGALHRVRDTQRI